MEHTHGPRCERGIGAGPHAVEGDGPQRHLGQERDRHPAGDEGLHDDVVVGDVRAGKIMAAAAAGLVGAGAQLLVLATNLMHKAAGAIEELPVPFLHVADAVAHDAARLGAQRVGVLGARPVMEEGFYAERLARHGIAALVPDAPTRERVDAIIFDELTVGDVRPESGAVLMAAVERLAEDGAQAVALSCTELELAVSAAASPVPLIPTARIHARRAAEVALAGS